MTHLILLAITIIILLTTGIICLNSNFENAFAQGGNSEIPPLIEPDKNITIMAMEKYITLNLKIMK